jgi:ligand-binding sensor domain-containing protein
MSSVIYAGTSDGRVWVTPNTGKAWYEVTAGLQRAYVGDICVDPLNARTIYLSQDTWDHASIWRSTDAGGHWKNISDNLPPVPVHGLVLHPHNAHTLYAATEVGVFVSTDAGGRWKRLGRGLPNAPVYSIVANGKTGYLTVGTHGRGAWRIHLSE